MDQKAHHIQDASEKYAVAVLQQLAEQRGIASHKDSEAKMQAFYDYAEERELSPEDFDSGTYAVYKENIEEHLPVFVDRLQAHWPGRTLDFEDVEAAHRNANKKGDFLVLIDRCEESSVSLKNYRNGAARPQLCSGTFNSFVLNFLFEARGVGTWIDPVTGDTFRGGARQRDAVLARNELDALVPLMAQLDELNQETRSRFIDGPEFEFLDEDKFDAARKACGNAGAAIAFQILSNAPIETVKTRILKMTGFDGAEEALIIDQIRNVDTITSPAFRALMTGVQSAPLSFAIEGQGITFRFLKPDGETLLSIAVPFTINKNGAWISGEPYEGTRYHAKEGVLLSYNQRRPKKSRELAMSVNTYVNLEATGIFRDGQ